MRGECRVILPSTPDPRLLFRIFNRSERREQESLYKFRRRALQRLQKERGRSVAEDIFRKLVEHKGEVPIIKDQLPTTFTRRT
jgi:hypothetical protein